jgi:hypothetical protein
MEVDGPAVQREAPGEMPLSRCDLSVRAMNICRGLDCSTIGQLSDLFTLKGPEFVLGRPNCGKKTLAELLDLVQAFRTRSPSYTAGIAADEDTTVFEGAEFTAELSLASLEALQIPYGFPIEFVKLPKRIRNWCDENGWGTLGEFLRYSGAMSFEDLTQVDNIGRRSASEVIEFFRALKTREHFALRKFLPIATDPISLSLTEALHDLMASLDTRDFRLLEMRLVEKATLDAAARIFGRTRALVGQIQDRFLDELNRLLSWFSDERVHLWHAWELTDDLAPALSARGVVQNTQLLGSAISRVFTDSDEGLLMQQHWEVIFMSWGKELMASEMFGSVGVDIRAFANERGSAHLASRFQSWLSEHFGGILFFEGSRMKLLERSLTARQRALLRVDESSETRWTESYNSLVQYHAEHGNADVPNGWRRNRKLASWVSAQRQRRKKGVMSEDQIRLLDQVGFAWQLRERGDWEDRLAEVAAFKAAHGNCNIPLKFPENPKLGRFVNAMRSDRNNGTLSLERIAKLDALGFPWKSARSGNVVVGEENVSVAWKARFEDLVNYKRAHGDCDVPAKWKTNEPLANWVSMQRQLNKSGKLPQARVNLLQQIGFSWRTDHDKEPWHVRYTELLKFKQTHGHCDVPSRNPDSPSLGVWVVNQRSNKKRGKLTTERVRLLNQVGFTWERRLRAHQPK